MKKGSSLEEKAMTVCVCLVGSQNEQHVAFGLINGAFRFWAMRTTTTTTTTTATVVLRL